jgi:sn-glycerol 3-phosphate transport system substrate-binding protein
MRFKALLLTAALGLTAAFAQTPIEIWYSLSTDYGAPQFEAYAAEFNAEHPDVKVTIVYSGGYADTVKKAQAAVAAGKAPNVIMLEQTRGAGFVDAGAVLALDGLIAANPDFDLEDIYAPLLQTCTIDGTLYCLPFNTSTPLVYHNRDMFRAAGLDPDTDFPTTWAELLEIGPKFAEYDSNGNLTQWALGLATSPGWLFDAWHGQAGGSYLNEAGDEFIFNGEEAVTMLEFWLELVEAGAAKPMGSQTADFYGGNQVMVLASTATLETRFDTAEFDLGVRPLWCGEECYVSIGGGNLYLLDSGTEAQQQAAFDFLTWVLEPERNAEFGAATGYMAARQSALETDTLQARFADRPAARVTYDQLASAGNPRPLVPFWPDIDNQLTEISEGVLLDNRDPQTSLDAAVKEANRLLEIYAD